mmetsp:Transcript_45312/g.142120  ORF Transcript_45312/g.142120 Transcript_45312/m.142120 type:complete len:413 (-) Transcript_45312:39-1277(-)
MAASSARGQCAACAGPDPGETAEPLRTWEEVLGCGVAAYKERCPEDFARLLRSGVPPHLRWRLWRAALQLEDRPEPLPEHVPNGESPAARQIAMDLPRTFPDEESFGPEMQSSLGRILLAYAAYQPTVGYVQGMNFVAGLLLLVSGSEREAFAAFVCLMDVRGMSGFFREGFPLLKRYERCLIGRMRQTMPDLLAHFEEVQVSHLHYLAPWFMSLFIKLLPLPLAKVVWDVVIFEGLVSSIKIAVSILRACRPILLCLDMERINDAFKLLKMSDHAHGSSEAILHSFWARLLLMHMWKEAPPPDDVLGLLEDSDADLMLCAVPEELVQVRLRHRGAASHSRGDAQLGRLAGAEGHNVEGQASKLGWLVHGVGCRIRAPLGELASDGAETLAGAWHGLAAAAPWRAGRGRGSP